MSGVNNEKKEPIRPQVPEGYRWADELAREALAGADGLEDIDMAYELAQSLCDDPCCSITDALHEVAESNVSVYTSKRKEWLSGGTAHVDAFEDAIREGLVDVTEFDLAEACATAWCCHNESQLIGAIEEVEKAAVLLHLKDSSPGSYEALSPELVEAVEQMPYGDDWERLDGLTDDLDEQIEDMEPPASGGTHRVSIEELWRERMLPLAEGGRPEVRWCDAEDGLCQQAVLAEYAKEHGFVHDGKGEWYDAAAMAQTMDGELREELHQVFALEATDQEFMERYAYQHAARFGEPWQPECGVEFAGTVAGLKAFQEKQAEAAYFDAALEDAEARAASANAKEPSGIKAAPSREGGR